MSLYLMLVGLNQAVYVMAAHVNTILPLMRICKSMSPKMTRCLRRISNPLLSSQLSAVKFAPIQTAVPRCIHTTSICQAKKAKAKKGKATNKSPKAVAQEDFDVSIYLNFCAGSLLFCSVPRIFYLRTPTWFLSPRILVGVTSLW